MGWKYGAYNGIQPKWQMHIDWALLNRACGFYDWFGGGWALRVAWEAETAGIVSLLMPSAGKSSAKHGGRTYS